MYSSSSLPKHLVLVPMLIVVVTQLLLMHNVSSLNMTNAYLYHKCSAKQGEYKPGSHYEKVLNSAIQELSKNSEAFRGGYVYMDYTDIHELRFEPERVYITFQCRGDTYGPQCRSCFATARSKLSKRCSRNKGAIIWYDQCLFEFSSISTAMRINYDDNFCMPNTKNISGDSVLDFLTLMDNLTTIAVTQKNKFFKHNDQPGLYAAGEKRSGKMNLYAMVQCTNDLTVKACEECVSYNILHFQNCYENKPLNTLQIGARVLGRSCGFRFERYPFINVKTSPNYSKF